MSEPVPRFQRTKRPPAGYPCCDGKPIADNTSQYRWIVTIHIGLASMFCDRDDVFVASDLLWYPVKGDNRTRTSPDAMVVFGRPKGDRWSYMQWKEGNIAPQVVFEVLSPRARRLEMRRKFWLYQQFGVEEFYVYDPGRVQVRGWLRQDGRLRPIAEIEGWRSPRRGYGSRSTGNW